MAFFDSDIDKFRQYVPGLTVNYKLGDVLPQLDSTQRSLLAQFLGDTLAAQLDELVNQTPDPNDPPIPLTVNRALELAKLAVARIGFAGYLPFAEIQIGGDGVTITSAADRKAAFEYQTNKITAVLLETGWKALDELISLVAANPSQFPGWAQSPYYEEHQRAIFKTPAEFSRYYPIQDRWLTFWALRPFIRAVEENQGEDYLPKISQAAAGDVDLENLLKRKLNRALAYQAVLDGIPLLSVELKGVNVQVNYASQFGNATYYTPPTEDQLSFVLLNLQKQTDLAWSAFDEALTKLDPDSSTGSSTGAGLLGGGAITML